MDFVIMTSIGITYLLLNYLIDLIRQAFSESCQEPDYLALFDVLFELHIRNGFPTQSGKTLSCLKAGARTALRPKASRRPCVLLLLHSAEGKATARRLAVTLLRVCLAATGRHRPPGWVEERLALQGRSFAGLTDFWTLHMEIRSRLEAAGMTLIEDFHKVHPHAATLVTNFTHELFLPGTKTVMVLLMKSSWVEEPERSCPEALALTALERTFGHSLDEGSRNDLLRVVAERPAFVLPETAPLLPRLHSQ